MVDETLADVGAQSQPRVLVLNKADSNAGRVAMEELQQQYPEAIAISAKRRTGMSELKSALLRALAVNPTAAE